MNTRMKSDDGIAAIFTALLLVVLLVFAALAVDLGQVYSAKRNDQNAVDSGALGAALDLGSDDATLIKDVKDLVHSTLGTTFTDEQWRSCGAITDPDPVDSPLPGANCITINLGRTQIQVRTPTVDASSVFGRAVGISGYAHSAMAIASLARQGFGSIIPFGLAAGAGGGDGQVCIKTGPGGHADPPCDGSSSGNFGYLDFAYFGSDDINTGLDCGNGGQRNRNANSLAAGVDHDLSTYGGAPHGPGVEVIDTASPCGGTLRPNAAYTLTGNTPQDFGSGIYSGTSFSDGLGGRLQRSGTGVFNGAGASTNVGGFTLDDNPLWEFLPTTFPAGANVPNSCAKNIFTEVKAGTYTSLPTSPSDVRAYVQGLPTVTERMRALLGRCISHYNGVAWNAGGALAPADSAAGCTGSCSDPIFTRNSSTSDSPDLYDIQYTARFGYVPQLTAAFPSGNATVRIASFMPIFFQRLLAGNCNSGSCSHDFEPGVGYSNSSSETKADGITAFVLPRSSLPNRLGEDTAPFDINVNKFVQLIR